MNFPEIEKRSGGVLFLQWDKETFAGAMLKDLDEDTHVEFQAHQVSNPEINLSKVNDWWKENKAELISKYKEAPFNNVGKVSL